MTIPGVILAGGRSQRLGGGDKCLLTLGDGTILDYVVGAVGVQVSGLAINSNSAPALFAHTGLTVLADVLPGRLGPLAGIHTAMLWARERGAEAVLTVPADTPFLPRDLVARLDAARETGQAAIAVSGTQIHPVVGLWPNALAGPLEAFLAAGVYRARAWLERVSFRSVVFEGGAIDPFWNINTPEDAYGAGPHGGGAMTAIAHVGTSVWRGNARAAGERALPEEVAVALSYDRETFAVMMASPEDLQDFAVGFSLSEGIIGTPADITAFEIITVDDGIECRMTLAPQWREALRARRRRIAGPVGCGLCGLDSLKEVARVLPRVTAGVVMPAAAIADAFKTMSRLQVLNHATHAVHAAAYFEPARALLLREDIGRHNALDKLIGAAAQGGLAAQAGALLLTSRVSLDLIQKAACFGAGILAAISVPTARAVREADAAGITLIAVARDDGFEVFTHAERVMF